MADNVSIAGAVPTYIAAADEATYSGDTAKIQLVRQVHVSGAEGAKTVSEVVGTQGSPAAAAQTVQDYSVSTAHLVTAATTNPTSIKASAGRLRSVHVFNKSDAPVYVKFHNTAGAPTAGAGVALTVGVQAGASRDFVLPGGGRAFDTGIAMTVVAGIADANNTAVAADDAVIEVSYE